MIVERTTLSISGAKRQVTRQDVFAESTDPKATNDPSPPLPLTQTDFDKYAQGMVNYQSPQTFERAGAQSNGQSPSEPNVQVVGSFDELNGVLTHAQSKQMHKKSGQKVKLISLEEAARQAEVEQEALMAGMPEDAVMIQGQGGSGRSSDKITINGSNRMNTSQSQEQSDRYILDSTEEQSEEAYQLTTQANTTEEISFLQHQDTAAHRQSVTQLEQASQLIDPSLLQRGASNSEQLAEALRKSRTFAAHSTVPGQGRTLLPPIFERSFEQSDIASSLGPAAAGEMMSHGNTQVLNSIDRIGGTSVGSFHHFRGLSETSMHRASAGLSGGESQLGTSSPLLAKDEEKWPVSQQQTVVVVTRTYQEQKTKQRRKVAVAVVCILLLLAWLCWALLFTT